MPEQPSKPKGAEAPPPPPPAPPPAPRATEPEPHAAPEVIFEPAPALAERVAAPPPCPQCGTVGVAYAGANSFKLGSYDCPQCQARYRVEAD